MAVQYRAGGDIFGRLNIFGDLYVNGFPTAALITNIHVSKASDLPSSNGVIFLSSNTTYTFTTLIDLEGKRLVCGENVAVRGTSGSVSSIISTGLDPNLPLLSSNHEISISEINFGINSYILDLNSANPANAVVFNTVNFINSSAIGRIRGYNNVSLNSGAFINSGGLKFDGNCGTVSIFLHAIQPPVGVAAITALSSINISRRFRVFYSSLIVDPGATGILLQPGATIPNENLILDNINFSNGGTYTSGFNSSSIVSRFDQCVGVSNSSSAAQLYMSGNTTPTIIPNTTSYFKMSGTADIGSKAEKFVNGNSRLTYIGAVERDFLISGIASMTSGNNNVCYMAVAKNGVPLSASQMPTTTSGTGRSENIKTQVYTSMLSGDYIEVFVRNSTGVNNITVTDVNLGIEAL